MINIGFFVNAVFAFDDERVGVYVQKSVESNCVDHFAERGERHVLNRCDELVVARADVDAEIVLNLAHGQIAVERAHNVVECGLQVVLQVFVEDRQAVGREIDAGNTAYIVECERIDHDGHIVQNIFDRGGVEVFRGEIYAAQTFQYRKSVVIVERLQSERIDAVYVVDEALDGVQNGLSVQGAVGRNDFFLCDFLLQLSHGHRSAHDKNRSADSEDEKYDTDDHTQNES